MKKHDTSKCTVAVLSKKVLPNCRLELVVSVPSSLILLFQEEAIDRIVKTVSLPGFRKGKVPKVHILESFGQKIHIEWQESLAKQIAQNTIEELGIRAIPPVVYAWKKLEKESENELQFSIETYPMPLSIEDLNFSDFPVLPKKEVSDEDVENKINEYRKVLSNWDPLEEGSPLEKEDRVSYCLFSHSGEKVLEGKECLIQEINAFLQDILLNMEGREKKIDLSTEIDTCSPGTYHFKLLRADRKHFPPLDEAFAQRFKLQKVDELREEIKKRLQSSFEFDYIEEVKSLLQDFLVEQLSFELPLSLLEKEIESRFSFASNQNLTKEEVEKQAKQALSLFFFIESIAVQHRIQLTKEHLDFIWSQNPPGAQGENGRQRMAAQLMQHEVLLFILQRIGWIKPS